MDKSALNRATDATSAPTPGYLYNDIARTLLSPQACTDTLKYLSNKLSKNNPHVKKKALKVLTKTAAHPASRGRFKRCIVQDPSTVAQIKECTAWRGTMDAVTGDQWNVEVREAAKECLDVIYSDDGADQVGGVGMTGLGGGGMSNTGFGGGAYGAPMGGAVGSGVGAPAPASKYEGIGNPMYKDPRMNEGAATGIANMTVTEVVGNVGSAMMEMIKDPLARHVGVGTGDPSRPAGGYGGPQLGRPDPYASNPPGRNKLATQTGGQWTMASNRGPNAIGSSTNAVAPPAPQQNSEYYKAAQASGSAFQWAGAGGAPAAPAPGLGGVGGSWGAIPAAAATTAPSQSQMSVAARARAEAHGTLPAAPSALAGSAVSNGDYEKNLIAELCPPGGMKAEPPQDKLAEFSRAVPSLNPDCVCPALLDALEEGNPWIMRAKALCVIETVLKVMAETEGSNAYADFFHACSAEIAPLANHARAAVKGPAKRVLALLGLEGEMAADGEVAASASTEPSADAPSLLDFDEPATPATAPPVATSSQPVPAAPQPVASVGGDSLFSGLNTKAGAPVPPAPVAPAPVPPPQEDDLLGGFDATPAPETMPAVNSTPAPSNDLFGDVIVKSTENDSTNAKQPPTASPPSVPGSAFGFMNAAAESAPPAPPTETPATPSTPAPQTFDPLLSLGASGSGNPTPTGTLKPNNQMQQMQMAYQQQMMMMQQQMQQMQMAYGQGQAPNGYTRQGNGGVPQMPMGGRPVMGANYMRQVPGVQGDKMTSFSFLGEPKKQESTSFDFVKDAMKKG